MSLSAVIVDDEQLARDELAFLLKSDGDVNVVAQGKNGLEAVNLIKEHNPDLVFLDVQMPGLDGFGVIKKLLDRKIPLPKMVFATAFDQYAVKAFEVNAVDYLLKPFDKKRVAQSLQKARTQQESEYLPGRKNRCACEDDAGAETYFENSAQNRGADVIGGSERRLLRLHRGRRDHCRHGWACGYGRAFELPHAGRTARQP